MKRSERLVDMTKYLMERPHTLIALPFFAKRYGAAKSSISEDLAILKHTLANNQDGILETVAGAAGGLLPLMAMTFVPGSVMKWVATILAVALTSALTGFISSKLGNGLVKIAVIRNIVIGLITITIHYGVGKLF